MQRSSAPGDFLGPDLAAHPDSYAHELPAVVRAELARLLVAIGQRDDVEAHVRAVMADANARTTEALASGPGVILLRGVPVEGHDRATLATLFTMMGRAGPPRSTGAYPVGLARSAAYDTARATGTSISARAGCVSCDCALTQRLSRACSAIGPTTG